MKNFLFGALCALGMAQFSVGPTRGETGDDWQIVVSRAAQQDEAIKVVLEDLQTAGAKFGISFKVVDEEAPLSPPAILVGDATRNAAVKHLGLNLSPIGHEQGYEILTRDIDGDRTMVVAGGSTIGDVYGLYWIWDRIRVHKHLPKIDTRRTPTLPVRVGAAWGRRGNGGRSKQQMRHALRYGTNWVSGPAILDLVPWESDPERASNEDTRNKTRELIDYAHSLHMKYFSFANEFTYHPSLLEENGATLDPCDPAFWDALQEKFRKLFKALPELDGIELCNDDISGFWDAYRAFDPMHQGPEECEWPYDKRFRTFVKKVSDVVVGEFDKTYFHFTWALTSHEIHNQPSVFKEIFTDEIPTDKLYLLPKVTAADRWWHQPYNPTFNLTPHETLVLFETMNYYEGGSVNIFPTFSGQYFQAGLQTFLSADDSNVRGMATLAGIRGEGWGTVDAYAYVLHRLAWDPDEDMEQIARDFCALHFGSEAAETMVEIYLLSPIAYKYGLHIEPVSYGKFNSFVHMRVGTFPVHGFPDIDGGREHLEFLRGLYLRCKPWIAETLDDLDHGLATAVEMEDRYRSVKDSIEDTTLRDSIEDRLRMTRLLINTNNLYVKTMFAFFDYIENDSDEHKANLAKTVEELERVREVFRNAPGFNYHLAGVDILFENARAMLEDDEAGDRVLHQAFSKKQIFEAVADLQDRYRETLKDLPDDAVKFAHVEIAVDGRDLLRIQGDQHEIEHLRWDGPFLKEFRSLEPLPREAVTVIPKVYESKTMHPFILEQPSEANDYTVSVYLFDIPGGHNWWNFDLYYIRESPEELGLRPAWER